MVGGILQTRFRYCFIISRAVDRGERLYSSCGRYSRHQLLIPVGGLFTATGAAYFRVLLRCIVTSLVDDFQREDNITH
jgi:hypothetical protein